MLRHDFYFHRDAVVVTLCNCGTSVFAGFVIFSIIGFMASQLNVEVADVAVKGRLECCSSKSYHIDEFYNL